MTWPIHQDQDRYWKFLVDPRILQRAAHLVGVDSRADFRESYIDRQIFSYYRDEIISDIIQSIGSGRYLPHPISYVNIPKSDLSQRPGTMAPFRDRIVIHAITMILAPMADQFLTDNVWSWRVKPELRGKSPDQISERGLFGETDISDLPFLKRRTIRKYIEEFEPWYALWPDFDIKSRAALREPGYKYMLFSDIAGYFENISLPMLKDLLVRTVPESPNVINLLMQHLRAWCRPAYDGSIVERGIPQGNACSSFLGNLFLKPVDDFFAATFDPEEVRYFRYMDDIRIITKTEEYARHAALALEEQIRRCQLNLQSSKTKLLTSSDAVGAISDNRLEKLDYILPAYRRNEIDRTQLLVGLNDIYRDKGSSTGSRPIAGGTPLDGLNLRVLRRWASTHYAIMSDIPVQRIVTEALGNPNYKVTRELQRLAKRLPHKSIAARRASNFITARKARFEYHEAELLRSARYFHYVPAELFDHAARSAEGSEYDSYIRFESVLLLARQRGFYERTAEIVSACIATPDNHIMLAGVLAASLDEPRAVGDHLRTFATHASHEVSKLVQYVRALRFETGPRADLLSFVFGTEEVLSERVYDFAAFLRFIGSGDISARKDLEDACSQALRTPFLNREFRRFLRFLLDLARGSHSHSITGV